MKRSLLFKKFSAFVEERGGSVSSLLEQSPELSSYLQEFFIELGSLVGNKVIGSQSILESISEGVCLLDEGGLVTFCSATASSLLGVPSTEVLGQDFVLAYCRDTIRAEDEPCCKIGARVWIHRPDGSKLPVLIRCGPLAGHDGETKGRILTISDISYELEKEDFLRRSRDEAILQSQQKSNFLATVSHEIRTPINGILSLATLLKMYEDVSPEMRDDILDLEMSAKSLSMIINSVLDFSKLEADKIFVDPKPTLFHMLIQDIEVEHRALFKAKNQYFFVYTDPTLPSKVNVDTLRIKQIVSNLLSNANKFTSARGCVMMYAKGVKNSDGSPCIEISVADTGIGIVADKLDSIFETFSQGDASITRSYGGTGLGLAICKKLVEILNGKMEVKSRPGIGSVFKFVVPVEVLDGLSSREESS